MKIRTYLLLFPVLFAVQAVGEIYKWIDENGKVHYGDRLPQNAQQLEIKGEVNTVDKQSYNVLPKITSKAVTNANIIMYATSWCPYCKKARKYFKNRGIRYTEYDIEKNPSAKSRYDSLGGKGVPLILIGDRKMSGFSVERFEYLYKG